MKLETQKLQEVKKEENPWWSSLIYFGEAFAVLVLICALYEYFTGNAVLINVGDVPHWCLYASTLSVAYACSRLLLIRFEKAIDYVLFIIALVFTYVGAVSLWQLY